MRKRTHEEFTELVKSLGNNEYEVLGHYVNNSIKIAIKHLICGYEYSVKPNHFINSNSRCPKCAKNLLFTTETFKQKVLEIKGSDYTVLGEYKNALTHILIKHNICGHKWMVKPANFVTKGTNCPICFGRNTTYTTEVFKEKVFDLVGDEYTVLDEFIDTSTKIKLRHNKCNNEYYVNPSNFLSGKRCPHCKKSKGEMVINDFLNSKNIDFVSQFKLEGCKNIRHLFFDFVIFNKDEKILIEYDGIQHYKPTFGEESFQITQHNDQIKNEFCKQNNIPLVRIPYWEFDNLENILENALNEHLFCLSI